MKPNLFFNKKIGNPNFQFLILNFQSPIFIFLKKKKNDNSKE